MENAIIRNTGDSLNARFFFIQGVPWDLTKSIGILDRQGSIHGPIIRWDMFTDA
jgi:hypothetical protein